MPEERFSDVRLSLLLHDAGLQSFRDLAAQLEQRITEAEKREDDAVRERDEARLVRDRLLEVVVKMQCDINTLTAEAEEWHKMATGILAGQPYTPPPAMWVQWWKDLKAQRDVLAKALEEQPCRCKCLTHGFGCGIGEATCRKDYSYKCSRCEALGQFGIAEGK